MNRAEIVATFSKLHAAPRRITADSRQVESGWAFAAYPGTRADGRDFIGEAIARGADAVLWDSRGFSWRPEWKVPNVPVDHLQPKLGYLADFIYGSPSESLWVVGVTGTNGKTSCAHWIATALDRPGRRAAVLGTLGNGLVGALAPAANTTADAASLHATLAQLREAGATEAVMEVSSHGLDQGRVNGVKFDVALFTNLTRDHLDYHGTMAAYGLAKARLFTWPGLKTSVINADDPFGQSLIDAARHRGQRVLSYGVSGADVRASGFVMAADGLKLSVTTPWGTGEVATRIVGAFNVHNLLGTLGVLLSSDLPLEEALAALARLTPPPGRMQRLGGGDQPLVVVDYAHTPDALEKVLGALRSAVVPGHQLVCVFGCGGERDPGKRPEMGRAAANLADRVVITSDNPRGESPSEIASAVSRGVRESGNRHWTIELDRGKAIRATIAEAQAGDVVLLAGKGHEDYQERDGVRVPFSDALEAERALAQRDSGKAAA
jgi:UDP-N-acetylmuramoyl-L-alanyl-D-glutamate--2,6-diaminopimelate ligase